MRNRYWCIFTSCHADIDEIMIILKLHFMLDFTISGLWLQTPFTYEFRPILVSCNPRDISSDPPMPPKLVHSGCFNLLSGPNRIIYPKITSFTINFDQFGIHFWLNQTHYFSWYGSKADKRANEMGLSAHLMIINTITLTKYHNGKAKLNKNDHKWTNFVIEKYLLNTFPLHPLQVAAVTIHIWSINNYTAVLYKI